MSSKPEDIDKRLFRVIELLVEMGRERSIRAVLERAGIRQSDHSKVKAGLMHFSINHVTALCVHFHVNANFIIGTEANMFVNPKNVSKKKQ